MQIEVFSFVDNFLSSLSNNPMTNIKNILSKKSYFSILFLICGVAPILLKLIFFGTVGPTFNFYYFVFWIPLVGLTFSMLRGWKECSLTGILIISAFLIAIISYPSNPAMDFQRQFIYQLRSWMVTAVLVSLILQLTFVRSSKQKII